MNTKSPTSVECAWNKYGSGKTGIAPKLLSDTVLKKPHYKKKGQCKVINPVAKKLFNPTRKKKIDRKPNIKDIASYLYASVPDACAFQYLDMKASSTYPPDDDINVVDTLTIETSMALPRSIPKLASATQNIQELLDNLNGFTQEQAQSVESGTRGQNDNNNWSNQRLGRITASISRRVLTKVRALQKSEGKVSSFALVNSICKPPNSSTAYLPAFQYGHQMESEARSEYLKVAKVNHKNVIVQECGLFISKTKPSPDVLVTCKSCGSGILEIKCPISVAHLSPSESRLPYLRKDDNDKVNLNNNHPYYSQIQHQLSVTGRLWCDFFVYSRHGHYIERILFDPSCWLELETAAEEFFTNHVGPKLIEMKNIREMPSNSEFDVMCCICKCCFQAEKANNVDFICGDCSISVDKLQSTD